MNNSFHKELEEYVNNIKSDYESMKEQKILSEGMTEKEFGELLENNVKSFEQRQLLKRINEFRPGWVTNLRIAEAMENYFLKGKVWAVENPTDGDFAKYLSSVILSISTLEIAALINIGHEYKKEYQAYVEKHRDWYK